jgi:hypothetical protein
MRARVDDGRRWRREAVELRAVTEGRTAAGARWLGATGVASSGQACDGCVSALELALRGCVRVKVRFASRAHLCGLVPASDVYSLPTLGCLGHPADDLDHDSGLIIGTVKVHPTENRMAGLPLLSGWAR